MLTTAQAKHTVPWVLLPVVAKVTEKAPGQALMPNHAGIWANLSFRRWPQSRLEKGKFCQSNRSLQEDH